MAKLSPNPNLDALLPGFAAHVIDTGDGVHIHARSAGTGPALLVLHGHPQTMAIWHRVAPALTAHFTVVLADLRGYGDSAKPAGLPDHANYSRRAMAEDMVRTMRALGHERFAILAHDRGARVAHRLALDHPHCVTRMVLLDICPTLAMYEQTTDGYARAYWHWFFLIQPAPTPERLIEADPGAYVRELMGRRHAGLGPFDPRAIAEYTRCLEQPGAAHALCEDYRAAATIDLEHDRASITAGQRIEAPLMVLWGTDGVVARYFKPLEEWSKRARQIEGGTLPCGHYLPEEAPQALLDRTLPFLRAAG